MTEENSVRKKTIKKKRKNKRATSIIPVIILLVLFLICINALAAYYFLVGSPRAKIKGEWISSNSIRNEIVTKGNAYLNEATMGNEIDFANYLECADVSYVLTINSDGTYTKTVNEKSLDVIYEDAYKALFDAVSDLMYLRIVIVDPAFDTTKDAEEIVEDAIGMRLSDYIADYGPELISSKDSIREGIEDSGTYTIDGSRLVLTSKADGSTVVYDYAVNKEILVISSSDNNTIYRKNLEKEETINE